MAADQLLRGKPGDWRARGAAEDRKRVREYCASGTPIRAEQDALIEHLWRATKRLVRHHRDAIERVADALLEQDTLDSTDVRSLIEDFV